MPTRVIEEVLQKLPGELFRVTVKPRETMTFLSQEDHVNAIKGINPERLKSCGRAGYVTSVL